MCTPCSPHVYLCCLFVLFTCLFGLLVYLVVCLFGCLFGWLTVVSVRVARYLAGQRVQDGAAQALTAAVNTVDNVMTGYRDARVRVQGNWSWIQGLKCAAKTYQEWKRTAGHKAAVSDVELLEKLAQQLQLPLGEYVIHWLFACMYRLCGS